MATTPRTRRRFGRIRKLPSGRYQAGYTGPDGAVHNAEQTFPTKGMAERWLSLTEADVMRGEWSAPERRAETVAEWAEKWLEQGQWRPRTKQGYATHYRSMVADRWANVPVGAIERDDVREWVAELSARLAPRSVRHAVTALGQIAQLAVDSGAIPRNPARGLRLPTPAQRPMCVLTVPQVEALASEIARPVLRPAGHGARSKARADRPDLALWVRLAAYCGLRAGELAALRREDIDFTRKMLIVDESIADVAGKLVVGTTKTGHRRAVPIPPSLLPALRRHLAAEVGAEARSWVFSDSAGGAWSHAHTYSRHFSPAVERAGLPAELRFHDLRHTYAALLIAEGAHPRALMERMGHSSITVTLGTYGHLLPGLDEALTDRLDRTIAEQSADAPIARILHVPNQPTRPDPLQGL